MIQGVEVKKLVRHPDDRAFLWRFCGMMTNFEALWTGIVVSKAIPA